MMIKDLLKVELTFQGKKIVLCNYIRLEKVAATIERKFSLYQVSIVKDISLSYHDIISISVFYKNKTGNSYLLFGFDFVLIDFNKLKEGNDFIMSGIVVNTDNDIYNQSVVDVYNLWNKKNSIKWFNESLNIQQKSSYISACMKWGNGDKTLFYRSEYSVDFSKIREDIDFYYIFSESILGERGYVGYDLYTLNDCLLDVYKYNDLTNICIKFTNTNLFKSNNEVFYSEIMKILTKYKIKIIES